MKICEYGKIIIEKDRVVFQDWCIEERGRQKYGVEWRLIIYGIKRLLIELFLYFQKMV